MKDKDLLREFAKKEPLCTNSACRMKKKCFRHMAWDYLSPDRRYVTTISPSLTGAGGKGCPHLAMPTARLQPRGFSHIYDDMPHAAVAPIARKLQKTLGRTNYFSLKRGDRTLTADERTTIENAYKESGMAGKPQYDAWEEGYE